MSNCAFAGVPNNEGLVRDLVNQREAGACAGRPGQLADKFNQSDFVIDD